MLSLAAIVGLLDNVEKYRDLIEELGRRHLSYGVKPEHYPHVGAAMIKTIRHVFGDTLGPKYYSAWETAFAEMSRIMIVAAYHDANALPKQAQSNV